MLQEFQVEPEVAVLANDSLPVVAFSPFHPDRQIQDRTGQYSDRVKFPLSLNNFYQQEPPPPEIFKDADLGPILIRMPGLKNMGPSLFRHLP